QITLNAEANFDQSIYISSGTDCQSIRTYASEREIRLLPHWNAAHRFSFGSFVLRDRPDHRRHIGARLHQNEFAPFALFGVVNRARDSRGITAEVQRGC